MYSSRRLGRTLTSIRASSSNACPDTIRLGCPCGIMCFAVPSAILICVSLARYPPSFGLSCPTRGPPFWGAQRLQCAAQQLLKISSARLALRFADVGMNQEVHFGVQLAERGVRRQRHLHEVAHAAHVQEHLIRSFFGKAPAKLANHRSPVLPLSLRPSTRHCEGRVGRICDLNR